MHFASNTNEQAAAEILKITLGAWWDDIRSAITLNDYFKAFCGGKLTISAGIGIFPDKYPVHRMADITGGLESVSKTSGKNAVTLFDESLCFTWDELNEVVSKLAALQDNIKDAEKGMSFVYKLLLLTQGAGTDKSEA